MQHSWHQAEYEKMDLISSWLIGNGKVLPQLLRDSIPPQWPSNPEKGVFEGVEILSPCIQEVQYNMLLQLNEFDKVMLQAQKLNSKKQHAQCTVMKQ